MMTSNGIKVVEAATVQETSGPYLEGHELAVTICGSACSQEVSIFSFFLRAAASIPDSNGLSI